MTFDREQKQAFVRPEARAETRPRPQTAPRTVFVSLSTVSAAGLLPIPRRSVKIPTDSEFSVSILKARPAHRRVHRLSLPDGIYSGDGDESAPSIAG